MSKLFAMKEERRRKLANLPITEKMEIAQRLQDIGRVLIKYRKRRVSSL